MLNEDVFLSRIWLMVGGASEVLANDLINLSIKNLSEQKVIPLSACRGI